MAKPITIPNTFASATSAIPLSQLDQDFSTLANATNDLATYSNYVADTGAADAYIANFPANTNTASLTAGLTVQFKAANANTGASTLNVQVNGSTIGTAAIRYANGSSLAAGAIAAGALVSVMYDGTNFQLINDPAGQSGGDVTGPASATDNAIARFDGASGKLIQNSVVTIADTTGDMSGVGTLSAGNVTVSGTANAATLIVTGNSTLGDASGDTLTITGTTVTTPNGLNFDSNTLVIDAANNRVGVNNATPTTALDVTGTATISTNLAFTGTGNRITGDFSNATITNRVMLQTSTADSATVVGIIPNGTGAVSVITGFTSSSDPANSSFFDLRVSGSQVALQSGRNGTGTFQPLTFLTGGSERLRIDTSGNVGIGNSSPNARLRLQGASVDGSEGETNVLQTIYSTTAQAAGVGSAIVLGGTFNSINGLAGYASISGIKENSTDGNTASAFTVKTRANAGNLTERMRIDSSGNVGIGESSPDTRVHIYGASTAGRGQLYIQGSGTVSRFTLANSSDAYALNTYGDSSTSLLTWDTSSGYSFRWTVLDAERMRIDSGGNVGIGTSSPSQKLHVAGSGIIQDNLLLQRSSSSLNLNVMRYWNGSGSPMTGGAKGDILAVGNTGADPLVFATSDAERMRITSGGNVGIGTSSPSSLLDIESSGDTSFEITKTSQSSWLLQTLDSGVLRFYSNTATAERMRIDTSGNLLIGTTTTSGRLSVVAASGQQQAGYFAAATGQFALAINTGGGNNYYIATVSSSDETLRFINSGGGEKMRLTTNGDLFIGKTAAATANTGFEFNVGTSAYSVFTNTRTDGLGDLVICNRQGSDGKLILFSQANTEEGSISVSGTTVSYNGGHLSRWSQLPNNQKDDTLLKGTVMSNLDDMCVWNKDGEFLPNEQLNKMKVSDTEGDTNVAGVFVNWTFDEQCKSDDMNVAMTGDMIIRIAKGVVVQKGDLLMSAGDGTAKPQGDDIVRSKTVAKVTSNHVTCTYADGSYCVPCVLMAC